ncbi:hypothetical protein CGGC5_v011766 [Colletotrichum fructicola Nara gc5]|uniref:Acid phosphatase n=1 Tax=Colletotrichum fructicola (strain Nara gc5) TaxID=1213859 RepID=A0A7J6ITH9_COLFN|nr:hypothetical protein CGGC5_v011766 [Colletotrichum fructicola Nara gc5]
MAHPYAPLGGCYDDPIVDIVAGTLLRHGFLVGTFNFRGASGSAGRTSWTAKPERSDYMSFIGFMVYYMHFLDPFGPRISRSPSTARAPSPPDAPPGSSTSDQPVLLLGGYSYGAMITTQIPPIAHILAQFKAPAVGSAAADIRLRAQHLAEQQNVILASARAAQSTSPRKKYLGMRVGGDEDTQRKSHDSRRSFSMDAEDKIRRGVNELLAKTKRHHHHLHHRGGDVVPEEKEDAAPVAASEQQNTPLVLDEVGGLTQLSETKLVENQTLALFGDKDGFVPVAKLRNWVERLESVERSRFHGEEVATAGHFWTEGKVASVLRGKVAEFAALLVQQESVDTSTGVPWGGAVGS